MSGGRPDTVQVWTRMACRQVVGALSAAVEARRGEAEGSEGPTATRPCAEGGDDGFDVFDL